MSWARLDDGFWAHPKILAAGNAGAGIFARCLSYCAAHLTDGRIPVEALRLIVGENTAAFEACLTAELLVSRAGGAAVIRDYLTCNPSKTQVLAARSARASRVAKHRARNADRNALPSPTVTPTVTPPPSRPVPSHPIPTQVEQEHPPVVAARRHPPEGGTGTRGTRIVDVVPDDWRTIVLGFQLDPETVLPSFHDYWRGVAGAKGRKADWPATLRNWCRREAERVTTTPAATRHYARTAGNAAALADFVRRRSSTP